MPAAAAAVGSTLIGSQKSLCVVVGDHTLPPQRVCLVCDPLGTHEAMPMACRAEAALIARANA